MTENLFEDARFDRLEAENAARERLRQSVATLARCATQTARKIWLEEVRRDKLQVEAIRAMRTRQMPLVVPA